jgi:SAM-dependent methyltransferase
MDKNKKYFLYLRNRSLLGRLYRKYYLYPRLVKFLKGSLLDVGCGIGDMLDFRPNSVGIDINPHNVAFCKRLGFESLVMHNNKLPFKNLSFDSVLLDNVLEHIESPSLLFEEIRRILKPDGVLLVGVPGIKGFQSDDDHKVFYDEKKLRALAQKNHFNINHFFYTPIIKSTFLSKHLRQYCIYSQWSK